MGLFPLWSTKTRREEKTLVPEWQRRKNMSDKSLTLKKRREKEKSLVYSWMCVSLFRNVHSQPDHDDITLLSPATFCFDFFFFIAPSKFVNGRR